MGNVDKRYCDWNGEDITGSGVQYSLSLYDQTSGQKIETAHLDLCQACYTKFQTYLKGRSDEVDAAWVTDAKAVTTVDPTTVDVVDPK